MNRLRQIALVILILGLSVVLLIRLTPPVVTAQEPDDAPASVFPFRIYLPFINAIGLGLNDALGFGVVSLPDPDAPGDDSVNGPAITFGVSPGSAIVGTNVRAAGGPNTGTQAEISLASSGTSIVITFNDLLNPANADTTTTGYVTSIDGGITFSAIQNFPPSQIPREENMRKRFRRKIFQIVT